MTTIVGDHPCALADRDVLALARSERRILITNDTDFGELIVRRKTRHAGVVLFRLKKESVRIKIKRLDDVLARFADELDQYVIIDDRGVRIRRRT